MWDTDDEGAEKHSCKSQKVDYRKIENAFILAGIMPVFYT
jgi:hypothetical protein